ncbi:MAG: hypothetical protein HeimC2_19240 [Candidatus Heimdallarchaeota archaeon LC_2]|nr:MAG: hypothetical protein HeimC2_19240 [Candidatus Heimdallarchaeota archaeon LC_2]
MVNKKRSLLERATAIFSYIEQNTDFNTKPIPKSEFQSVGISPRDMDRWIELIMLIQSMPQLIVKKMGKRTYVDSLDNKFTIHMKKTFLNQAKSYEERESALLLYFKALLTFERIRGEYIDIESIVNENWKIDRPTIVRIAEEALSEINS